VRFHDSESTLETQSQDLEDAALFSDPLADVETSEQMISGGDPSDAQLNRQTSFSISSEEDCAVTSLIGPEGSLGHARLLDNSRPLWPLATKAEAFLLQHFATELALWVSLFLRMERSSSFNLR
jgi:hypothetical protein